MLAGHSDPLPDKSGRSLLAALSVGPPQTEMERTGAPASVPAVGTAPDGDEAFLGPPASDLPRLN
jgi:hypothetical protein